MFCHSSGHLDIVEMLVNKSANIDAQNYLGFAPIHFAGTLRCPSPSFNAGIPLVSSIRANLLLKNAFFRLEKPLHGAEISVDYEQLVVRS